jgi:hypothetical protein
MNNQIQPAIDFLLYGPSKTGSTSLSLILSQSKNIRGPKDDNFEPMFFTNNIDSDSIQKYNELFNYDNISSPTLYFEKSTRYFKESIALYNIVTYCKKDIKFIIVLRNPINRFISEYIHFRNVHNIIFGDTTFMDKLSKDQNWYSNWSVTVKDPFFKNYQHINDIFNLGHRALTSGLYTTYLKKVYEQVPNNNIYLIKYEDFKNNNHEYICKICEFLNIPIFEYVNIQYNTSRQWIDRTNKSKCYNAFQDITTEHIEFLKEYYFESNQELDLLFPNLQFNYNTEIPSL